MNKKRLQRGLLYHRVEKMLRTGLTAVCAALFTISQIGAVDVLAADYETTYKVILYSGDKGTFNGVGCVSGAGKAKLQGDDTIVVSGLHYGDTININVSSKNDTIKLNAKDKGKYQPTGTRRSGRDNSEAFDQENMTSPKRVYTVTSDRTFVVTYGVPGKMVSYTVSYVLEGTDKPVPGSKEETFYGVAGDKPVVSAPYFEGYKPLYKAITGTLKKGKENSWVFEYKKETVQTATEEENPQEEENQTNEPETENNTPGTDETGESDTPGTDETEEEDTPEDDEDETDTNDTTAIEEEETPTDLLDLDDEKVPTGNVDLDDSEKEKAAEPTPKKRLPIFAGIGVSAVILLGFLIGLLIKKRKALSEEES